MKNSRAIRQLSLLILLSTITSIQISTLALNINPTKPSISERRAFSEQRLLATSSSAKPASSSSSKTTTTSSSSSSSSANTSANTSNSSTQIVYSYAQIGANLILNQSLITDCYTCSQYGNSKYCNTNNQYGWCCLQNDNSPNCTDNPMSNTQCSMNYTNSGKLFFAYCTSATAINCGGMNNLDITATNVLTPIKVNQANYLLNSQVQNYSACYWHFTVTQNLWKKGARINFQINVQNNVSSYIYYGNSRRNSSKMGNILNDSLTTGVQYYIDASSDAMLVMIPFAGAQDTQYSIQYQVTGSQYNWFQRVVQGPHGQAYFIAAVVTGGVIALILIIVVNICIYKCCVKHLPIQTKNKVDYEHQKLGNPGGTQDFSYQPQLTKDNSKLNIHDHTHASDIHLDQSKSFIYDQKANHYSKQPTGKMNQANSLSQINPVIETQGPPTKNASLASLKQGQQVPQVQRYQQAQIGQTQANNPFIPENISRNQTQNMSSLKTNLPPQQQQQANLNASLPKNVNNASINQPPYHQQQQQNQQYQQQQNNQSQFKQHPQQQQQQQQQHYYQQTHHQVEQHQNHHQESPQQTIKHKNDQQYQQNNQSLSNSPQKNNASLNNGKQGLLPPPQRRL